MIKKIISRILTVTLLASCVTFSGNKSVVEAEELPNSSISQIVEPGGKNIVETDKVTTSKTIVETGVENEFEITLQVTTEEDIQNITISPDAATVLVLDRSTSMNERSGSTTRFQAMKTAAKNFLTEFADIEAGSNAKRLVSIVSFATDVKNETYNNAGGNTWIDVTSNLIAAEEKINGIANPNGWTNIEGSLLMANNIVKNGKDNNLLNGSDGNVISNINIILLTDGSPTAYANNSNSTSINTMSGVTSNSTNSSRLETWKPVGGSVNGVQANTNNISKTIKDSGTNLYTIAFSTTSVGFYYESNRNVSLNPSDWMATFATRNFLANNASELTEQFEKINKLIALSAQAWKVTDPMGENIIYKEIEAERANNSYSFDNNTLKWDIKNSDPVESTTQQGNKKYTYTLKYKVVLDTTNPNVDYNEVLTNGDTILDYYLFSKQDQDESRELKHARFNVPKVKGLFGELNFTKVNEVKTGMPGVSFTLSGTATGSEKSVEMTVESDSNGKVNFSKIPAGEYTLTEATPSGYVGAGPWDVKVSYGNTTKDKTLGDTVINHPLTRDIAVEKTWSGLPEDKEDIPEAVTIRLYKNDAETDKSIVLNNSNEWNGVFTNLPYVDERGEVIKYSVKEDKIAGYQAAIVSNEDGSKFTINNSYNPELIKISGIKTWVDESGNGIEGEVPEIVVTLQRTTADNWSDESKIEDLESITLKSGETQYTFDNLPKTATNSKEYKYRVRESKVDGYEPKYNENFDIINIYTPGETSLTVNKVWNNVNIENDVLPEVTAVLYQGDKVFRTEVLNKANGYSYTFTNLPKYAKTGVEYEYTVKEKMQDGTVGYASKDKVNEDGSVTITNTFDNEKISIKGRKEWEGIPENSVVPAVTLRLYQNGVELTEKAITLNGGVKESEVYSFDNLPRYSTDGKEYVYTVKEDTVNGYISSGEWNKEHGYIITNTFIPETITVMGQKTWSGVEDLNDVPTITIKLESSLDKGATWSEVTGKVIELTAGNTKYEFENLPKYSSDGREYQYRVAETPIVGYTSSNNGSYNILNTYTPEETAVKVTKIWTNVDPNTDEVPEVNIILKQNGAEVGRVVLNKESGYSYTFENLDKYAPNGLEYKYDVEEVLSDGVTGYTEKITPGNDGYIVENIFDNTTIDINFTKVWEGINKDSKVPEIKLYLYQDDKEYKTATLTAGVKVDGKENYVFEDLPKYSTTGEEYTYKVVEEVPSGYISTGEATVDDNNNATIINTFDKGSINVSVEKKWEGVSNENIVPTITLTLESSLDGEAWIAVPEGTIELVAGTTAYEFKDLPKYSQDGREYKYRVVENDVNGYETSYGDNNVITNTYTPGEKSIKVTKIWTNVNPEKDTVPKITIILKRNGVEVESLNLDNSNGYTHTFKNLPKYAETGEEYVYTVEEILPTGTVGYSKKIEPKEDGYLIENIFDKTSINITFTKVWENVTDTSVVPNIYIDLYQNGNKYTDESIMLKGGNKDNRELTHVFNNLPKYSTEGKEYVYTIKEKTIMGYEQTGEATVDDNNNATITNKFTPGNISISGTKTWNNVDESDLNLVPTITIRLQSSTDGILWTNVEGKVIELKAGELDFEFTNIPEYSVDGYKYKYRVVEDAVNGYKPLVDLNNNITNTYMPDSREIKVTKKWTNVNPNTDEVPVVTINLMRDGDKIDSIILNKDNSYTHTFENLAKYAPTGKEYVYTVEEVLSGEGLGYTKEIITGENEFVIENIFDKEAAIDIQFNKLWENVPEGSEVPSITLHLYQNGVELTDKVVTLIGGIKESGQESYIFNNLPKYSTDGKEYVYTIQEGVVAGYETTFEANKSNEYTIINKFVPGNIVIKGEKTWAGVKDLSIVPTIKIRLEASLDQEVWNAVEGRIVELAAGETQYEFNDLPKYSTDGREIKYRVIEEEINGYIISYNKEYNITNTYAPGETSIKVTKKWTNVNPSTDTVPEVKIILKQDGIEFGSIVLDKDNNYTYVFKELSKYAPTGKEYDYTIEEVISGEGLGYTKEIISGEDGFVIENIFDRDAVIDIQFNKLWKNAPEGSEVPSITLHLYQNGVELTDKVVTLDGGIKENGRENYVFKNLPKYSTDGKEYVYTIKEDSVNGYISSGEANISNEYTITNTYDGGEKVVISGKKTWVNVKDPNKVPNITIRVLRDGKEIHSIVVPSGTTTYKIALDSMVKYAPDGHEYVYSLTEDKLEGFKSERDGYNFTNTNIIKEAVSGTGDVKTGDNSMMILYASLAVISLSLISIIALRKRRKTIEK